MKIAKPQDDFIDSEDLTKILNIFIESSYDQEIDQNIKKTIFKNENYKENININDE